MGCFDEAENEVNIPPTWGLIRDKGDDLLGGSTPSVPIVAYKKNRGFYLFCLTVSCGDLCGNLLCRLVGCVAWVGD